MSKFKPMFSISFCFQLLQRITWLSQYLHFSNYRDGCVDILYISTVSIIYTEHIYLSIYLSILSTQGWVCAAIGCVQCTAVFLSSSSICLIAVDRWEHQGLLVLSHLRVYAKCAWNWDANTKVMRDKQLHRFLSWLWFLRWYPNFKPTYSV